MKISLCYIYVEDKSTFREFVVSIIIGQPLHFFRNACIKSGSLRFSQFPVVDWFCLFIHLWVLTLPLEDCSEFGNFVITLTEYLYHRWPWIYSFCHQHIPALLPCYSLIYYFAILTIVSLFVFFFLYFLYFLISINGFCLLRWYLQTFRWQTHNREEVTE